MTYNEITQRNQAASTLNSWGDKLLRTARWENRAGQTQALLLVLASIPAIIALFGSFTPGSFEITHATLLKCSLPFLILLGGQLSAYILGSLFKWGADAMMRQPHPELERAPLVAGEDQHHSACNNYGNFPTVKYVPSYAVQNLNRRYGSIAA